MDPMRRFVYISVLAICPQHVANGETLAELAAQIHVTPAAIVASQASEKSSLILGRLSEATQLRAALSNLRTTLHTCEVQIEQHDCSIAAGNHSSELDLIRHALVNEYNDTATDVAMALMSLRTYILQDLDEGEIDRMECWKASALHDVPPHLRIQNHTVQEWEAIELALKAQARSAEAGDPLTTEDQALILSLVTSESTVAQTQLSCCLAAIMEQFETGVAN
jgi:hypothetical protein